MAHHAKMEHAELVSKDPAATQKFLEHAFQLKFTVMGPEMGNYRMHGRQEGAAAGAVGIREPMDPKEHTGSIPYFTIPNLNEALKSAKAAGAHVLMDKQEVPGAGWLAVFMAPGEVTMGLFQNKGP